MSSFTMRPCRLITLIVVVDVGPRGIDNEHDELAHRTNAQQCRDDEEEGVVSNFVDGRRSLRFLHNRSGNAHPPCQKHKHPEEQSRTHYIEPGFGFLVDSAENIDTQVHPKGNGRRESGRDGHREHHLDVFIQTVKRADERQQARQNIEDDDEGDAENCKDAGEGNAP